MIESVLLTATLLAAPSDGMTRIEQIAASTQGYAPSLYRGDWYHKKWEDERKCIMKRESHYNYQAENKSSSASGAYQFLDSQWRDGLVWMMLDEGGNKKEIKKLRNKPISKWSRYYQDRAFFTAWRHGEGRNHWSYEGGNCW